MVKKPTIVWEPTAMQKHPDSIKSSDFTDYKPLKPSYLKEKPCIKDLLSMAYSRKWFEAKENYEKSLKPSTEMEYLERKYVLRGLTRKKQIVDATCHLIKKPIESTNK